ncbi:hypothetical protein Tco_1531140 [Tanacetum coccineum]
MWFMRCGYGEGLYILFIIQFFDPYLEYFDHYAVFKGRHKDKFGMQIPNWMITEEMKHTEHYRMYAEVFGLNVLLTQSQPNESTQGTHRTPSAPRSPTPKMDTAESSAPKRSTVIYFRLPERRSIRLTPPASMTTVDKADEMILQDTLQVRSENVIDDSLPPRNDEPKIPGTRLEPRSDKESPKVEITNDEEVEITNVVIHVNVNEEEDEITDGRSYRIVMVESLPTMVDTHIKEQVKKQVPETVHRSVPVYVVVGMISGVTKDFKRKRLETDVC